MPVVRHAGRGRGEAYTAIFENSRILHVSHYGSAGPRPAGMVMVVNFELDGQDFIALNGGPEFTFDEAISFQVNCDVTGGDRPVLDQAVRGRRGGPVRMGQGQVRRVLADRPHQLDELIRDPDHETVAARR